MFAKIIKPNFVGRQAYFHLLQEMRSLAGTDETDDLLEGLWLQRLPRQTQLMLKASTADLDGLSRLADSIEEVSFGEVMAVSNSDLVDFGSLSKQIAELGRRFDNFQSRSRSKSRGRCEPLSHQRLKSPNNGKPLNLCWYHHRFGNKAAKCRGECNFVLKAKNM